MDGDQLGAEELKQLGLIRDVTAHVKLLGNGTLTKRVTVRVHGASESAKLKVQQAGGSVQCVEPQPVSGKSKSDV